MIMRLFLAFILAGISLCELHYQGIVTDLDGEETNLFTTEVSTADAAISNFHASYNGSDSDNSEHSLEARGGAWLDCDDWGSDAIGGGAGCNSRHSPQKFYIKHGHRASRVFLEQLVNSTLGLKFPSNRPRSSCLMSPKKNRLCVSWAPNINRGFDQEHVARIVDVGMACLSRHQYSAMIMTDTVRHDWVWICISDRPKKCHTNICADWRHSSKHGLKRPPGTFYKSANATSDWLDDAANADSDVDVDGLPQ